MLSLINITHTCKSSLYDNMIFKINTFFPKPKLMNDIIFHCLPSLMFHLQSDHVFQL